MFSKSRKSSPLKAVAVLEPPKVHSKQGATLSADVQINGDVTNGSPIYIEGEVRGDIRTPYLTVGTEAQVTGTIESEVAKIDGTVTGQINAQTVALSKTGRVVGDIVHEVLSIEAGAYVEVNLRRRQKSDTARRPHLPWRRAVSRPPPSALAEAGEDDLQGLGSELDRQDHDGDP